MRLFGLIGFPLSHSFSGKYFTEKFRKEGIKDARYELFPISSIDHLPDLIKNNRELLGLNVTIPYKEDVLKFLEETEEGVAGIGAVNTIKILRSGDKVQLEGYNTDFYGFRESILPLLSLSHSGLASSGRISEGDRALILGTGGASKAVEWVLKTLGFEVILVSRAPKKPGHISYHELNEEIIATSKVIVNTTPRGMYPHTDDCPEIPYEYLTENHILYDLIYNPAETLFMKKGRDMGAVIKNGLQMLHLQADKSWEIWNE